MRTRYRARALLAGAVALAALATACAETTDTGGEDGEDGGGLAEHSEQDLVIDWDGEAATPAADVPDAQEGGNITILQTADFEHLDPPNIYVSNALSYGTLFHRRLTGYIEAEDGSMTLVGDLATNPGVSEDEGRKWTYTLREGIAFEDGTPITSADVAHGIARSFTEFGAQGPQFLQNALDPEGTYEGPFDGEALPPGVSVPDDQTIVFEFAEPFPGMPYVVAFPTSAPVPEGTGAEAIDRNFVASGPYKIQEYRADERLVLERNDAWDPATDPIRKQYVDTFTFEFGVEAADQTERLRSASGDDATALMNADVAPELIATVKGDSDVMSRAYQGPNIFSFYIWINTQRVDDVDVRRALNYAFDRDAYIKAVGGYDIADPATTIMSPVTPGYKQFDAFPEAGEEAPGGPHTGNPEMAMELLEGKDVGTLKYCTANTELNQEIAAVVQAGFARADITIEPEFIDPANYFTTVGTKSTDCDLSSSGWGQDYPDGETVIGTIMDGAQIRDEGNYNYSYFTDPDVEAKIAELRANTDRGAVAAEYGELDEQIMTEHAPLIPGRYGRDFVIHGPRVGNAFVAPAWNDWNLAVAYVIPE